MEPVCFLDMDGVLVDFVTGAHKLHNKPLVMADIRWEFDKTFGISGEDFWSPMGREFWAGLDWTPEGKELLRGVEKIFGPHNVCILTSPCQTPGCRDGKVDWVTREIPQYERRMLMGSAKHHLAAPNKMLVDDYDGNCDKWNLGGGRAVRVPRPWNGARHLARDDGSFLVDELLVRIRGVHREMAA